MTSSDATTLGAIALVAAVPLAVIMLALIVRGYTVSLHMHRPQRERRRKRDQD